MVCLCSFFWQAKPGEKLWNTCCRWMLLALLPFNNFDPQIRPRVAAIVRSRWIQFAKKCSACKPTENDKFNRSPSETIECVTTDTPSHTPARLTVRNQHRRKPTSCTLSLSLSLRIRSSRLSSTECRRERLARSLRWRVAGSARNLARAFYTNLHR